MTEAFTWRVFKRKFRSALRLLRIHAEQFGKAVKSKTPVDARQKLRDRHSDHRYLTPSDLSVTDAPIRRVLFIGSCPTTGFPEILAEEFPQYSCDFLLANNMPQLPETPPEAVDAYSFQVLFLPMRGVLPQAYFHTPFNDTQQFEDIFRQCKSRLSLMLRQYMKYYHEHRLTTFVTGFLVPQANPFGRLMPRHDLRNIQYFVEQLNAHIEAEIADMSGAYYLDVDVIAQSMGRKNVQDDHLWYFPHNFILSDADYIPDINRIDPTEAASVLYPTDAHGFGLSIWQEIISAYRTVSQTDQVKIVITDLDDTLWRGVIGDTADPGPHMIDGWLLGYVEALNYLKRRGVILAIASKNFEETVVAAWPKVVCDRIDLADFAIRKINWNSKVENIGAILREANLLPSSAVFIDDNPREREAVAQAFPGIRVLGRDPYYLRRILLWAPETQVATITDEASRRNEMIQRQVEREEFKATLSREDYVQSLEVKVTFFALASASEPRFARAFELINKTNQFNTTGKRWTGEEMEALFRRGGYILAFDVKDRFTSYGLVGCLIIEGNRILQMTMSCRVIGMDVEKTAVEEAVARMRQNNEGDIIGNIVPNDANLLSRDIFQKAGFFQTDTNYWVCELAQVEP